MTWMLSPFVALWLIVSAYGVSRALRSAYVQPETDAGQVAPARTSGERAWRDAPLQTFMWQLQAARYSKPPFSRT